MPLRDTEPLWDAVRLWGTVTLRGTVPLWGTGPLWRGCGILRLGRPLLPQHRCRAGG
jgi:hypothetical protein